MRSGSKRAGGGWRHWTEAEAGAVLAELDGSGLSVAAFARARGISRRRLAYWRERQSAGRVPAFVPVEVAPMAEVRPAPTVTAMPTISVELQGVVVRVREDIAVAKLVDLVVGLAGRERGC